MRSPRAAVAESIAVPLKINPGGGPDPTLDEQYEEMVEGWMAVYLPGAQRRREAAEGGNES